MKRATKEWLFDYFVAVPLSGLAGAAMTFILVLIAIWLGIITIC